MNKIIFLLWLVSCGLNAQVSGYVFEDLNGNGIFDSNEKPLPNVLVSNGKDIVKTSENGKYFIAVLPYNPLFIIKPKGYISPINNNKIIAFFKNPYEIKVAQQVNFPLLKNKETNNVKAVVLGDPQVDVIDDVQHVAKLVIEELAEQSFDFMIPVGDLSFDNLNIFSNLSKTLGVLNKPVFYTIGNHDLNYKESFKDVNKAYEKHFGPSYYAFEFGNEFYLVLNNIYPTSDKKYEGRIDEIQYQFIKNLLGQKKKIKKITVFMHIPLEELKDKKKLINQFKEIEKVSFIVGHTHTQYHRYFKRENHSDIHELVAGAVCGAWWQGPYDLKGIPFSLMYDGTEKGYWFADFEKENVFYTYKVSGKPISKQINIWTSETKEWNKELNELNEPYIYANVFAGDENTKVSISFNNGESWKLMQKYEGISPYLKRLYFLQKKGKFKSLEVSSISKPKEKSNHLWRIAIPKNLPKGIYLIKIKAINKKLKLNATDHKVLWKD